MTVTIIVAAVLTIVLAGAGAALTDIGPWYRALAKPSWNPPDWAFGPAWTLILTLLASSGVLAWRAARGPDQHREVIILFAVNWICHLCWSPLFFKLKRPDWALAENVLLWCSILALVIGLRPLSSLASWLDVPYLLWVSFALYLNYVIVQLNKPFSGFGGTASRGAGRQGVVS
jgi:tryptophan-rich sensory protein